MKEVRSRRWQLTENNYDYTREECLDRLASVGAVRYAISACEVGESGTKHIHTFVVFQNAIRNTTLKEVFARAHLEQVYGTNEENVQYCVKQGEYIERGRLPEPQGKKDVASAVIYLLLEGKELCDIMRDKPEYCDYIVRNFRSLKDIEHNTQYGNYRK